MMMQKIARPLACAVLATGLAAGAAAAQDGKSYWQGVQDRGTLRCGAAVAPPYVMRDPATGEYSGFFASLCRDLATVLQVEPEFVDTTWDNIVAGLQAGKWDVSLALSRTPARAMAVNFSDAAMNYQTSFVYNKDNPKIEGTPTSFADIDKEGVVFVVMSGTSQDITVSAATQHATIMRLPNNDETRMAMLSKRADFLVDASDTNAIYAGTNGDWAVMLAPQPALAEYGVGFGLPYTLSYSDISVVNIFVEQARASGKVEKYIAEATAEAVAAAGN